MPFDPKLPSLSVLGRDLLLTSRRQRIVALSRPFLWFAVYVLAASAGWWWTVPLILVLLFISVVTAAHDVVHGALNLSARETDWALFFIGALVLESGHAYRLTHFRHHRVFPEREDPEGDPARMSFLGAVLHGPIFLPRLWRWAWTQSRMGSVERRWLLCEAAWVAIAVAASACAWPICGALLVYAALVITGGWVYPLLTVHLPHRNYGDTPLTQTHTLRGRIVPRLCLELTYHLEHHLYPEVPSHNLPALSSRLEPYFEAAGVVPTLVP
jgi:beta-carotene hydroxylase